MRSNTCTRRWFATPFIIRSSSRYRVLFMFRIVSYFPSIFQCSQEHWNRDGNERIMGMGVVLPGVRAREVRWVLDEAKYAEDIVWYKTNIPGAGASGMRYEGGWSRTEASVSPCASSVSC